MAQKPAQLEGEIRLRRQAIGERLDALDGRLREDAANAGAEIQGRASALINIAVPARDLSRPEPAYSPRRGRRGEAVRLVISVLAFTAGVLQEEARQLLRRRKPGSRVPAPAAVPASSPEVALPEPGPAPVQPGAPPTTTY